MQQQEIAINVYGNETFKSRFGYHPCNYETFCKIKKIRRYYYESLPKAKSYYRWARKAERNRKGNEPAVPPVFCEIVPSQGNKYRFDYSRYNPRVGCNNFGRTVNSTGWIKSDCEEAFIYLIPMGYEPEQVKNKWGSYTIQKPVGPNHDKTIVVKDLNINNIYEQVRIPRQSPDGVVKLSISIEDIDEMLSRLEKFFGH